MVIRHQEEPVQTLKTLGQCGRDLTPFCHLSTPLDCPTATRMILASSWYYPLHRQGKVSYFLIPWGERQLLSQCPKIACHSQLPDWRPSRGTQRQHESTARVSGTPLKHQLRAASQEDPACSEVFILFFSTEDLGVRSHLFSHFSSTETSELKMRLNIAIFFGALFGALGVLLFLVAFGSDYWLLATEVAKCSGEQNVRFFFIILLYLVVMRIASCIFWESKNSSGMSISSQKRDVES